MLSERAKLFRDILNILAFLSAPFIAFLLSDIDWPLVGILFALVGAGFLFFGLKYYRLFKKTGRWSDELPDILPAERVQRAQERRSN